jgi:hypothetical protein
VHADELNRLADLPELVGQSTRLRRRGAYRVGPCPFCGGRDRFVLKQGARGWRWLCRGCGGSRYRTAIDFVMRRDGLGFKEALLKLGGELRVPGRAEAKDPPLRVATQLPDAVWQASAQDELRGAERRLLAPEGLPARGYLLSRGLHRGTWLAWGLGAQGVYDPTQGRRRPALVLPWRLPDDGLCAVKYRFIDAAAGGLRYTARRGSLPLLFGLEWLLPGGEALILVEGELNAISIWQCLPRGVSCASFGSQNPASAALLRIISARYRRVFIWTDEAQAAGQLRQAVGSEVTALQSPRIRGLKLDANAMLQRGLLADFIAARLGVECMGRSVESVEQEYHPDARGQTRSITSDASPPTS